MILQLSKLMKEDVHGFSVDFKSRVLCSGKGFLLRTLFHQVLRIEGGVKILMLIDKSSEANFTTVVAFNKKRKRLIAKMRDINPRAPTPKETRWFKLIKPRRAQRLLGIEVELEHRLDSENTVKHRYICVNLGVQKYSLDFNNSLQTSICTLSLTRPSIS